MHQAGLLTRLHLSSSHTAMRSDMKWIRQTYSSGGCAGLEADIDCDICTSPASRFTVGMAIPQAPEAGATVLGLLLASKSR